MKRIIYSFMLVCLIMIPACEIVQYPYYLPRDKLNLSVVLDTSGSMGGTSIEDSKSALKEIVDILVSEDILSIVLFSDSASILNEAGFVSDPDALKQLVSTISASGGTYVSSGLLLGYEQVLLNLDEQKENIVILLCDGDVDAGAIELVREYKEMTIATSAVGVGVGADTDILRQIAREGGGSFYNLTDSSEISGAFRDEVMLLLSPVIE